METFEQLVWSRGDLGGLVASSQCERNGISVLGFSRYSRPPAGRDGGSSATNWTGNLLLLVARGTRVTATASRVMKAKAPLSVCINPLILLVCNNYRAHF